MDLIRFFWLHINVMPLSEVVDFENEYFLLNVNAIKNGNPN
jgi:hypothetical protein